MKVPAKIKVSTSELLQAQSKFLLLCAKYGCKMIDEIMDNMLLRAYKQNNRYAGNFLISKVCEEFQVTRYDLFESKARKEMIDARKVYCAVAYQTLNLTQDQIGKSIGGDRNLVYRAIKDIEESLTTPNPVPYQKELLKKYNRVLFRVKAYLEFKAKSTKKNVNQTKKEKQQD
ncbi:helix-turn-helix domain-containing protein [Parvicella tangerina]|uniref:Chromosomal replication initiator DnaA C-terminal domain-containing protein n=1 Tax=Parvicella tangerina TaxID=2829795 RepID=A0A916NDJ6_9FLAO|nr:helix-turn-helix domain-containing protein [Parvicella tangerina]CAG5086817.1 hypothetical protein CRYO30217_03293 [Parvicella tangerina]